MAKNLKALDQTLNEEHAADPQEDESLDETEDEQESGDDDSPKSLPASALLLALTHKKLSAERPDKVSKRRKVDKVEYFHHRRWQSLNINMDSIIWLSSPFLMGV
ncbi:hypothetical protein ACET3Z_013591 [Daucus carota]